MRLLVLVDRLVEAHPLNPGVRLLAADVELLLRNFARTQAWIREQLRVFPSDSVAVPEEEPGITIPEGARGAQEASANARAFAPPRKVRLVRNRARGA